MITGGINQSISILMLKSSDLELIKLENLWRVGAGEVQKKNSGKGKLNEKNSCTRQLTLKNIHAMA